MLQSLKEGQQQKTKGGLIIHREKDQIEKSDLNI